MLPRLASKGGESNSNDCKNLVLLYIFLFHVLLPIDKTTYKDDFTRLDHAHLLSSLETHRDGVSEGLHSVVLQDHVLVLHGHNQVAQCVSATQWEIAGSIFSLSHNYNEFPLELLHIRDTFLKRPQDVKNINYAVRNTGTCIPEQQRTLNRMCLPTI